MPELPTVETPDSRRNSRPSAHLKTTVTELKYVRCQNSRCILELPTIGTPDSRRNSWPSRLLKTSRWPLAVQPGQWTLQVSLSARHQNSRPLLKLPTVGTPDSHWNSRWSNPRTWRILSWMGTYRTRPVSMPDQQNKLALLSLKHSKNSHGLSWALMKHYLSTWCIPLSSTTFLLTQI